ncbi:YciI family protein [Thalassotalea euphylliae]|uniref:YciI family protein n=1 Tax=Thalassotalea euphylliae TaxID=1655234 RepID=UPI003627FAF1
MFIISLTYKVELNQVDRHLPAHLDFLKQQYADGNFIASGRKVPRTGGIILAQTKSRELLEEILSLDPFHKANIADYEITEFVPTKVAPHLGSLLEE